MRATVGYGLGIDLAKILLNDEFSSDAFGESESEDNGCCYGVGWRYRRNEKHTMYQAKLLFKH